MALKPQEVEELVALIKMVDFRDTFSACDLRRKDVLRERATPKQFLAALRLSGYHEFTVWDTYPEVGTDKWPGLLDALKEISPKVRKKSKPRRKRR